MMMAAFDMEGADENENDMNDDEFASLVEETNDGDCTSSKSSSLSPRKYTHRYRSFYWIPVLFVAAILVLFARNQPTTDKNSNSTGGTPGIQQNQHQHQQPPSPLTPDHPKSETMAAVPPSTDAGETIPHQEEQHGTAGGSAHQQEEEEEEEEEEVTIPDIVEELPGYQRPKRQYSDVYVRRGKPIAPDALLELGDQWGKWVLVDEKASERPKEDFFATFSNRDVPRDQFPARAWQLDTDYLSKFLPQGIELVDRAMEAILGEYGHSKYDEPDQSLEERSKLFSLSILMNASDILTESKAESHDRENGGWMTARSYNSLVRRLLHAIMTEDSFTFTMGGHSAAAGHGNHFQQSYTMQLQRVLEPVLARLGVHLECHNIGMGGLGTTHNAMASGNVYGTENDILMWDSGMTENTAALYEVFARQGLMSGDRVPILWGGQAISLLKLHEIGDAEVGHVGDLFKCCKAGKPTTMSEVQALELPWAARYLECDRSATSLCNDHATKFNATCWIDRPDFVPLQKQQAIPSGQASWHPGNRSHQLAGRALAFAILLALRDALQLWHTAEDYVLADDAWHVTSQYENTRSKVMTAFHDDDNLCLQALVPHSFCRYPVQGRSEFLPRSNPAESSIRTILKHGEYVSEPPPNSYDPPDVFIPNLEVPDGVLDYLNIIENGVDFVPSRGRRKKVALRKSQIGPAKRGYSADDALIQPGNGWSLNAAAGSDFCDGTYDSFCGRDADSKCLLYAHNDNRGGIWFNGLSGWLVMKLDKVQHGTIVLKIENWHKGTDNPRTTDWTCVNNDCEGRELESTRAMTDSSILGSLRRTESTQRRLKGAPPPCEDGSSFEFAIDGKITTWTGEEFDERRVRPNYNVDLWTLLEDPEFARDGAKDVELAIRLNGCLSKSFLLTHVYWH